MLDLKTMPTTSPSTSPGISPSTSPSPVEFCRQLAAPPGSANHYATLYLPAAQRPAAWAVLALRHELNEVVTRIAEPSVAQARLDWWQAELRAAAQGKAQHPIAQALSQHVLNHPGHDALLDEMLAGAQARLHGEPINDASDFALVSYRQEIVVWLILTDINGQAGRIERYFAHAVGNALAWSKVLHFIGRDAAQGEIWIAQSNLQQYGVEARDLMQPCTHERVQAMLSALGTQTRQKIHLARSLLPLAQQPEQIMAFVSLAHAESLLDAMQHEDWKLLDRRPELTPLHMLWLAWRTASKAKRGKLQVK
jgi:phytoene synthase